MKQNLPPMVNLDSDAIRRIREEKRLTQLYVAKVVGVTTDTVSRWENNRYPSIKRENALRLAEALEVPVEDILEKDEENQAVPAPEAPPGTDEKMGQTVRATKFRRSYLAVALVVLLLVGWFFFLRDNEESIPLGKFKAQRLLPKYAAPATVIPVRLHLVTDIDNKGFILRERFPSGWQLIEAYPPPSSLDNEEGMARWIIKPGEERSRIVYRLRVAADSEEVTEAEFSGDIVISPNGRSLTVPVDGDTLVKLEQIIWADLDGDGVIDDAEMLDASDTYDEMRGVHMDWKILEEIWAAGGYRWDDSKKTFVPQKPVPRYVPPPGPEN